MSIAHIDTAITHAGVGNISTRLIGVDGATRPLGSVAGTLGSAYPRRVASERVTLGAGELVVMYSDGLTSRVDLADDPALIRSHPIIVAQRLVEKFARGNDDALIAVVR